MLIDILPQPSEFETPLYSPVWAYTVPVDFTEILNKLDEIAQASLTSCVLASEADFDSTYDKMISDLEASGMADAEQMITETIKGNVELSK